MIFVEGTVETNRFADKKHALLLLKSVINMKS